MKGVILAGGNGSRLYPTTLSISKHLLHVYNKPMIYYPLSILMLSKISNILIIIKSKDYKMYYNLLGNGERFGIKISYEFQNKAMGIADGLMKSEKFVKKDKFLFILGDNIFWGDGIQKKIIKEFKNNKQATLFSYIVKNPNNFAVLNKNKRIIEKPLKNYGNKIITGMYLYNNAIFKIIKKLKPSSRNELEITDLNNYLLNKNETKIVKLGRGIVWYDAGTYDDLLKVSNLLESIEKRQGKMIGCLEEISLNNKWITKSYYLKVSKYANNVYTNYLSDIS
jgi:glucose-1-phosphate thymidylyltransferase